MKPKIKQIIFLSLFISLNIFSQNFSNGFNFYLPPDDTLTTKFLPSFPIIQINDFVKVDENGKFSVDNNPIRFWGTNLVGDGAFPTKSKAWFIAGRLRKMGFNLIRLHHLDNPWSTQSIFNYGQSTRQLNTTTLDRLENIISELKKNGIYIDMNLNVSRTFNGSDGVVDADSLAEYAKAVTIFDPQLIALQKEYAKELLTHVNPYTGLALVNDPVMAMVETINENSLYRWWRDGRLKPFALGGSLTMRHTKMLDSLFNQFLIDKYGDSSSLANSWNQGVTFPGENNQVKNGSFESANISSNWAMELHNGAAAAFQQDTNYYYAGKASAKIIVTNATGTSWHIQFKQPTLSCKKDSVYKIEFALRSDSPKNIDFVVMRDDDPYTYYQGQSCAVDTLWKIFTLSFTASEDNNSHMRISFEFASTGSYWIDDVKVYNAEVKGLLPGESLENKSVKRIDFNEAGSYTNNRVKDISEFYINLQNKFYSEMKSYLKDSLGVKVPIIGTNWNVGPGDLISQSNMDYMDNHSYWDHPSFPNIPWSSTDWFINNQPMVTNADGGTIPDLFAGVAFKGKPFTISEYNHPFPNRFQTELVLFQTAYLSFHDADAIMFFDYNSSVDDWSTDKISDYFDIHRNPALMSQMPAASFAYRNNFIKKADQTIFLNYSHDFVDLLPKHDNGSWTGPNIFNKKLALIHAVRNESFNSDTTTNFDLLQSAVSSPFISDTKQIIYNTNGLLSISTPNLIGAAGYLNNFQNTNIGNMKIVSANNFCTLSWLTIKGDSLSNSERSLITVASQAQNTGMIWNGTTTINDNWGHSPTQVYPTNLTLSLKIFADSIRVFPLNAKGQENASDYTTYYPTSPNTFYIFLNQNTDLTLWFGIEKYGEWNINKSK